MTTPMPEQWRHSTEFLPYHPQASHINPDHRDGWNACYKDAIAAIEAATLTERERCAKEAEHWQTISATPGHACGQYIAAAIRLPLPPTATEQS